VRRARPPRSPLFKFCEAAACLTLTPRGDPAPAQPAPTFASVPLDERRETSAHPPKPFYFAPICARVRADSRDKIPSSVIALAESVTSAFSSPDMTRRG
jgi:hypothetical protein